MNSSRFGSGDGDRTASHRKTRVALIVDSQRHLLAAAEKRPGCCVSASAS